MNATTAAKSAAVLAIALAMQTAIPASGATLTLTTSDGSGKSSFDAWDASAATPGAAPSTDNDYVVKNGKYIRVRYDRSFNGNTISFGEVGGTAGDMIIQRADAQVGHNINFANGGAYLNNGHFRPWESNRSPNIGATAQSRTTGPLTVCSPESKPFQIVAAEVTSSSKNTNNTVTISAPIKGAAGTALMLCSGGNVSMPAAADTFTIYGNITEFYGKLIVSGGLAGGAYDSVPVDAVLQGTTPGSVLVQSGARVRARYRTTTFTTARLQLQAGATILVNNETSSSNCGKIAVTEELSAAPGTVVQLMTHPYVGNTYGAGNAAFDFVVLTLPAAKGTIPLENFICPDEDGLPPCSLVTNLVDGIWQLTIHKEPHDVLVANDSNSTTISQALPSALTNATSWLSGEAPQAGRMYIASAGTGGLAGNAWPQIRTPYYANTATPFVFAGDALALGSGGAIYPCTKDVTFPMLNLSANTTYILSLAGAPSYLRGRIYLRATSDTYPQKIQAYMKGLNTVEAEMFGSGVLFVYGRNGSGNPYGDIEFTALNTNFTGRIKVYANVNNVAPGTNTYTHERVFVTDARNLGGPLDAFRADALELADYSVLEARNDVDLNVANRGVKVTGNAGLAAPENVTLAISNDITWDGAARKTGAGTLALGGAPRIASGATATLSVEQGFLQVRSTNAVNGVAVSFEDGAYLLVDPAATGDIADYGAVDLSANPFGGALPVAFDFPGGAPEGDQTETFAVATVADAAKAQSLNLSARRMRGYSVKFSTRTNANGTVTILARFFKPAFIMVVR